MTAYCPIFFDTEFTSLEVDADLISIALVAADGSSFYAVFNDYDQLKLSFFVKKNVLPFLFHGLQPDIIGKRSEILHLLKDWLKKLGKVIFWGDVPHYDWVFFCNLFGGARELPDNVHYICMDLATLIYANGLDNDLKRTSFLDPIEIPSTYIEHNALGDAQVGMILLSKLLKQ